MKKRLTHILLAGLLLGLPTSMQAQVPNGDFETSLATPRGVNNIYSYQGRYQYDDLPSWEGVLVVPPVVTYPGYSLGGDYLSTVPGAAARVNPQGAPDGGVFQPHSGNSCIALRRFPTSGNITDQGVWSQPVPIIPGHNYRLDYYVLRRPTSQYAEKIKVVVSAAGAQWAASSSTSKDISAQNRPYASVTSPAITDYQNWTHVTGTFTAQTYNTTGPTANTSYLAITYDRPLGTYDPSLYVAGSYDFSYYAIDDISITDMGCLPTPGRLSLSYNFPPRRVRVYTPAVAGADSYNWYIDGSLQGSHLTFVDVPLASLIDCDTPVVVEVEAVSATCVSARARQYIYPEECQVGSSNRTAASSKQAPVAYPNPATEAISIPADVTSATLVNDKGKVLQRADASGKLDVQAIPDGLYNLQMTQNGKLINQRIQVKH